MWKTATFLRSLSALLLALLHFGLSNSEAAVLLANASSYTVYIGYQYTKDDGSIVQEGPVAMQGQTYRDFIRPPLSSATYGWTAVVVASSIANFNDFVFTSATVVSFTDELTPNLYVRTSEGYPELWTARLDYINNDADTVVFRARTSNNSIGYGIFVYLPGNGTKYSDRADLMDSTARGIGGQPPAYNHPLYADFYYVPKVLDGVIFGTYELVWNGTTWLKRWSLSGEGQSTGVTLPPGPGGLNGAGGTNTASGTVVNITNTNIVDLSGVQSAIATSSAATVSAVQATGVIMSAVKSVIDLLSSIVTNILNRLTCIQSDVCGASEGIRLGMERLFLDIEGMQVFTNDTNELPLSQLGAFRQMTYVFGRVCFTVLDWSTNGIQRLLNAAQGYAGSIQEELDGRMSYPPTPSLLDRIEALNIQLFGSNSQEYADIQTVIGDFLNQPPFQKLKSFLQTDSAMITGVQLVRSDWVVVFPNFSGTLNAGGGGGGGGELSIFPGDHPKIQGMMVFLRCLIAWSFYLMLVWVAYNHFNGQLKLFNLTSLRAPPAGQAIFGVNVNWKAVAVNAVFYLGLMLAFVTAYAALFVLFDISCCGFSELLGLMNGSDSARMAVGMLNFVIPLDCLIQGWAAYVFFHFAWLPVSQFFLISLRVVHV